MELTGSWKLVYGNERFFVNGHTNTKYAGRGHILPHRSVDLSDVRQKIDVDARIIENVATMTLSTDPGLAARVSVKGGFDHLAKRNNVEGIRMRSMNISKLSGSHGEWLDAFDGTDIFASSYRLDEEDSSMKAFVIWRDIMVSKGEGINIFVREASWLDPPGFALNSLLRLSWFAKAWDEDDL